MKKTIPRKSVSLSTGLWRRAPENFLCCNEDPLRRQVRHPSRLLLSLRTRSSLDLLSLMIFLRLSAFLRLSPSHPCSLSPHYLFSSVDLSQRGSTRCPLTVEKEVIERQKQHSVSRRLREKKTRKKIRRLARRRLARFLRRSSDATRRSFEAKSETDNETQSTYGNDRSWNASPCFTRPSPFYTHDSSPHTALLSASPFLERCKCSVSSQGSERARVCGHLLSTLSVTAGMNDCRCKQNDKL